MNYLAHAHFSEQTPAGLAGAVAGDFCKGALPPAMAPALARAVRLHRRLDSFSDAHPLHLRSRNRVSARRRRFAGIIVDMAYDHFLARDFPRYAGEPLDAYTARVYAALAAHAHVLPARLATLAPRMASQDWLGSYRSLEGVGRALDGISRRFRRPTPLAGAVEEIRASYDALGEDFGAFYADAQAQAAALRQLLADTGEMAAAHGPNASSMSP